MFADLGARSRIYRRRRCQDGKNGAKGKVADDIVAVDADKGGYALGEIVTRASAEEEQMYLNDAHEAEHANGRGSCKVGREQSAHKLCAISGKIETRPLPFASGLPSEGPPHAPEVGCEGNVGHGADEGGCNRGGPVRFHEGRG